MNVYYCDASTYHNGKRGQDSFTLVLCPDGAEIREHIGNYSVNYAELHAIYQACDVAGNGDGIITDSQLARNWIALPFKQTKNNTHLEPLILDIKDIMSIKDLQIAWVSRVDNLAGQIFEDEQKNLHDRKELHITAEEGEPISIVEHQSFRESIQLVI